MAVFPEAKLFSGWNFRVKNEIQNSISEFASRYGMAAGDHCGDLADMMLATGTGTGTGSPAPSGHRPRPPVAARVAGPTHGRGLRPRPATAPATRTGHRQRTARPHGHGLRVAATATGHGRTRTDTDGHGHGTPASVETWRNAGTVAAGFKQKSRQPVREAGKGRRPVFKRGRRVGLGGLFHA